MSPNPKQKSENYSNFGGINTKTSLYITGENDVLALENYAFTKPGSLSSTPGSSLFMGATVSGQVNGIYEYEKLSGFSQIIFAANTNSYYTTGGAPTAFRSGLENGARFDYVTFLDTLFACNGSQFFKWDGTNAYTFSTPQGLSLTVSAVAGGAAGLSGTFQYAYGYLNTTSYYSDVGARATFAVAGTQIALSGFTFPAGYGITAAVIYRTSPGGQDLFQIGFLPVGGQTFVDTGLALGNQVEPDTFFFTLAPRYMELFQNHLFMVGFSGAPSDVWNSEVGQPETILPDSNFEFRTNDGDELRGAKFYNGALYVFKERSFGKIVGDNSSNFTLLDVSDQYGALSNNAIVTYEDIMLFLDRKGIARFNGAVPEIISDKIEDIFLRMNISAARGNATAIHHRHRNEIWFGIPVDGATFNNLTVIFDYISLSFTTQKGFNPSSFAMAKSTFARPTAFYGSYSGAIFYTSASLFSHNGNGMTYVLQSKFYNMGGPSTTMQYRRLFVDHDPIVGITVPMQVNFRVNEQSAIAATATIYLNDYQSRIDFGIPAKSLSVELVTSGASFPVKINGFTVEGRLQRKV